MENRHRIKEKDLIIKALECCVEAQTHGDCRRLKCPALVNDECIYNGEDDAECFRKQLADALSLIKSQEQMIIDLEKRLRYLLQSKTISEYDEVDIHTKEYVKDIHSLDANIEHLNEHNKELTEENERLAKHNAVLIEDNHILATEFKKITIADTVRKYREQLHRAFAHSDSKNKFNKGVFLKAVDQIAKEMLEGETK